MTDEQILAICKKKLRITKTAYDDEITEYIESAQADLRLAGIVWESVDAIILKAILTYVGFSFGKPKDYDKLKESYDEQKAQLQMATGYTNWGVG